MYGHNCRYMPPVSEADELPRPIPCALFLQILLQQLRRHVIRPLVDINKFRNGACLRDSFSRGDEGVRNSKNSITRVDSGRHDCKAQCVRAAAYRYRMINVTKLSKRPFKLLYHWSTDEPSTPESPMEDTCELFFEFHVRGNKINERNVIRHVVKDGHRELPQSVLGNAALWPDFQQRSNSVEHLWLRRYQLRQSRSHQYLYWPESSHLSR